MLVYILILFSGVLLLFLSGRARKQGRIQIVTDAKGNASGKKKPDIFEVMAWYLYQLVSVRFLSKGQRGSFLEHLLQAPQVRRDLRALEPEIRPELSQALYYVKKIKWFLILFFVGDLLALCISLSNLNGGSIYEGRYIDRNPYGEGEKKVYVQLETENGNKNSKMEIIVDEIIYTESELEDFYSRATSELEAIILGENRDLNEVRTSLQLPDSIEGYPFGLEWESSDYFLMDHQGVIQKENISKEGELIILTCHFSYREWQRDFQFSAVIFPPIKTEEEIWEEKIRNTITNLKEEQLYNETYILPSEIDNQKVWWKEEIEDYGLFILGLLIVTACTVYMMQDRDLHQKVEERNKQMLTEYPALVNRLTLYLGAGMTIKGAWNKIALDYRERKRLVNLQRNYTYEEMLFTCYEMQGGVAEAKAYEHFGKRCGLQPYTRLVGLLNQSLKKGNASLLRDLQKEAEDAQEGRRNMARQKGEEAGTKLLLPMIMMLGIVMVLVMVPAFFSFSM